MHGNWSNGWHANYTNSSYTNNTAINVTTDGIEDGYYIWGIGCVDVGTNENWSANRTITIDTIAPTASVTCTPSSVSAGTNVVCTCLGTDATSGINSSLTTANSTRSTSSVGSFTYTCDVTDNAGNTASTTATYTVTSSSGSGVTSSTWTNTYSIADTLFEKGHSKELGSKARMKFKVNNEYHHVGVKSISGDKATIEIASDPVEILLGIGEDAKLDLTEDNFYDLYVLLNSISNNKVNLTIQKINEEIPEEIQDPSIDTSGELLDQDDEDQDIGDKKSFIWLWILGIILILIMLIIIGMRKKYKK